MDTYGAIVATVTQRFPRKLIALLTGTTVLLLAPLLFVDSRNVVCRYVIAPLLLAGVLYLFYLILYGMLARVTLYERGIALKGFGCDFTGPLDAVVRCSLVQVTVVNQYQDYRGQYATLYVETSDGQATELKVSFEGDKLQAQRIHQALFEPMVRHAAERFERGEEVVFGAISVSKRMVRFEGNEVLAESVKGFCVLPFEVQLDPGLGPDKILSLHLPASTKPRAAKVSNPEVLELILSRVAPKMNRQDVSNHPSEGLLQLAAGLPQKYKIAAAGVGVIVLAAIVVQVTGARPKSVGTIHFEAELRGREGVSQWANEEGVLHEGNRKFATFKNGKLEFDVPRDQLEKQGLPALTLTMEGPCGPELFRFVSEDQKFEDSELDSAQRSGHLYTYFTSDRAPLPARTFLIDNRGQPAATVRFGKQRFSVEENGSKYGGVLQASCPEARTVFVNDERLGELPELAKEGSSPSALIDVQGKHCYAEKKGSPVKTTIFDKSHVHLVGVIYPFLQSPPGGAASMECLLECPARSQKR